MQCLKPFFFNYTFTLFQSEIGQISQTLQNWYEGCNEMLACLQDQAMRANSIKANNCEHKINIEKKVINTFKFSLGPKAFRWTFQD